MPIDLTVAPRVRPVANADEQLLDLRARLSQLQLQMQVHDHRLVVVVEGWQASGKRAFLQQVLGALDPCRVEIVCTAPHQDDIGRRHFLADFWAKLPNGGHSSLFYRSWYRSLLTQKVDGDIDANDFARHCDEINEFEAQQRDHSTVMVKYFFHLSVEEQDRRFAERSRDPWQRLAMRGRRPDWKARRERLIAAWQDIFDQSDTRWAPWTLIDAEAGEAGCLAAMEHLVTTLEKALPSGLPEGVEETPPKIPLSIVE